ncbi:hypothetical protein [Brasilonema sp. UFV-L1]|nr:hypothetical protein [Brasilonema sp. UFV-L1]
MLYEIEQHTYLKRLPYKQSTPLNEKYRVWCDLASGVDAPPKNHP